MNGQPSSWRRALAAGLLALFLTTLVTLVSPAPSLAGPGARAGAGFQDASVNGWGANDSMQGSFRLSTSDGHTVFAYCVDHGSQYPASVVSLVGDTIGAGPGDAEHDAFAYLLARHGDTDDAITAAALAVIAHYVARDGLFAPGQQPADVVLGPDPDWGGNEWTVYDRIQVLWAEGLAKRGPWTLTVSVSPQPYTGSVSATATLSGPGGPIAGEPVFASATGATIPAGPGYLGAYVTDAAGQAVIPVENPTGDVTVTATAFSAPTTINVYRGAPGTQPVAVGDVPWGSTSASDSTTPGGATVRIRKQSTSSYLATAGATFEVWADVDGDGAVGFDAPDELVATLTTGPTGDTPTATSPHPGRLHVVRETVAPVGHVPAGPWSVTPQPGETVTLTATNAEVADGRLHIRKLDAITAEELTGGAFRVEHDADGDGSFETHVGDHPAGTTLTSLRTGRYRVTEVAPPSGYTLPEVRAQILTVSWDATPVAEFVFADHRPLVTTEASATVAGVDEPFTDTVTLTGVAPATTGTLTVTLFGPYAFGAVPVCAAGHAYSSQTITTTGPGGFTVGPFVASTAGTYTFVAVWSGEDGSSATHACGLAAETIDVRPVITTAASDQEVRLGTPIRDDIVVAHVPVDVAGRVTVELYGPYADGPAIDCRAQDLVWSTDFTVTGSGTFSSPVVTPPASGLYTFVATWSTSDGRVHATHACGEASETVRVQPVLATSTSRASLTLGEGVHDVVEVTGVPAGWAGSVTLELFGPFPRRDAIVCDAGSAVASWHVDVRGPAAFPSAAWTPRDRPDVGWYSWLARYDGADGSFATHECGDEREVFVVQLPPAALLGDKRTAQQPDELVPGARFHVYAATADLPLLHAGCDAAAPAGVSPLRCDGPEPAVTPEPLAGHHFLGEVATDEGGRFRATVWRGVTYCVKEVVAPAGWRLDPAVRCVDAGDRVAEISLSNERLTTAVTGRKFDRSDPSVPVPGAEYVLYVVLGGHDAAAPLGDAWFRDAPVRTPALDGARSFAGALSDADGQLSFTVPAGYRWCALEVRAPAGWRHERRPVCTRGPVHPGDEVVLLLAEDRLPPRLARTGGRGPDVVIGLLGVCSGWLLRRAAQWRATRADREVSTC